MLVLSRKAGQSLLIGTNIEVRIQRIDGSRVVVAIEAPKEVKVLRKEVEDGKQD